MTQKELAILYKLLTEKRMELLRKGYIGRDSWMVLGSSADIIKHVGGMVDDSVDRFEQLKLV